MSDTMNSKQMAEALGVEAKALRVYLRTDAGKALVERDGRSYVLPANNLAKLKSGYAAYAKAKADDAARKAAARDAAESSTPGEEA